MTFRGRNGWRPSSRRNRRRDGKPKQSTSEGADRVFFIILAVFSLAALAVALVVGIFFL